MEKTLVSCLDPADWLNREFQSYFFLVFMFIRGMKLCRNCYCHRLESIA